MMNSQAIHTLVGPAYQSKMPLFDGTAAATVLSKTQNMSGFLDRQALQYSGAYLTYDPRGKDGAGFTPPWSSSKTSLLDGRSPMSHLSGIEGQNHVFYRQDSNSPEERRSHSSSLCHSPVKQGFTLFTKSPETGSPAAAVRKQKSGGENSSPPSENSVYLAIPRPVYRHNPCCNELGCVIGHRYSVEHGSPRPNPVYKHDWMQSDAHYAERPGVQRKTQDVLLHQRGLQFDPSTEPLKRISLETYSPSAGRTLPAVIDPNYSSYPCTPTRTLFGSLSEQSQRLQSSPRGYPSQYPSHPPYEHMTSEVYQERSPMSKYGQITQHPVFYYPHVNEEVQNSTRCKNTGNKQRDVPVILKHTSSNPRDHYIVPQSLHGEMSLPSAETLQNHSFMQGFNYPCYAVPRFNVNPSHVRAPQKRPHASPGFHSNGVNLSPTRQHMDHPLASAANPHKDSPNSSLHIAQSQIHSTFHGVDLTSPTRCRSQLGLSLPMMKVNRPFPSLPSWHMDQHILSPVGLKRLMDYSSCEAQATQDPVSTAAWLPQSPGHSAEHIHAALANSANARKIIYSPANATGNVDSTPTSASGSSVLKGYLKRSISHPAKIKEEDRDLCEVGLVRKRQKVEMENVQAANKTVSPTMPVIDNVFSLAPYQAYLQVSKVLFMGRPPARSVQSSEPKPDFHAKKSDGDEQWPVVCPVPKETCPYTPTEKPPVEPFEQKVIKVEPVDPSDTVEFPVRQKDCIKVTIKQEPEEADSSDFGPMLVIKKCEPDEPEIETEAADENETSDESKTAELTGQTSSYSESDASTPKEPVSTLRPKSTSPPQPPESKLNFKNIPPQCLKLSNYRIILPDMKDSSPAPPPPPPEKPPAQPVAEEIPKQEPQIPVRKRFFELHHSLCKLISKSVSASSEQELRAWLSQLPLTEPASTSTKAQKVLCLLGARAREAWLNEEMKSALHEVLERLNEYTAQDLCPFPHVMRTGAVFLPMLVMKELLFPMVQVSFIDQVLHEHKVALRPTTLSEEKILIQLHKRACSSRLRRLMSLKHLPDIYADVVNLLYYACVCKHLGLDTDDPPNREKDDSSEEAPVFSHISSSPVSPPESRPQRHPKDVELKPHLNTNTTKSRVKSSSRRRFLDNSLSDEEEADDSVKNVIEECKKSLRAGQSEAGQNRGSEAAVAEPDSSLIPLPENSWMCPLTLDELSVSSTDTGMEQYCVLQPHQPLGPAKAQSRSKTCSGVILKLRRMFSKGLNRKRALYQAVSDSGTLDDPSISKSKGLEGSKRTPQATHKSRRTGGFSQALRPLSSASKRKRRSLLKIKYCPYLSVCHSPEQRRRWVLRSTVQRAQRALRIYYPDLVGKRIRHLYEEDDKSEVWYRGEVLRVHEAHANPLKTIFEVRYDSEPEWKYYLELLIDYKKGWLKIDG